MVFAHAARWGDDTVTDRLGRPLAAGTLVTVRNLDESLADVYSDADRTPTDNPIAITSVGNLAFYADPGEYLLEANGVQVQVAVSVAADDVGTGGSVAADDVSFTPVGTIAATDVQAAIAEVASEAGTGVSDGDKGHITVSGGGTVWSIDAGVIVAAMVAADVATQAELDAKAPLASPALTGNPTAPTAVQGDNDTSIATTAFVNAEIAADAQPLSRTVNAQTDSYTLAAVDAGAVVTLSKATVNVLTIPANATVAFPVGTVILARQLGVGGTTITGATGVIVNGVSAGSVPIGAQYGGATLVKLATDTWEIDGGASQYGGRLLGESRGTGAMVGITSTSAIDLTPTAVEVTVTVGVKPIKVRIGCGSLDQSTAAKTTFIQFAHPVSGTVLAAACTGPVRAGVASTSPAISDLTPGTAYVFKLQTKVTSGGSGNINSFGGSPIAGCEPYLEVWEC